MTGKKNLYSIRINKKCIISFCVVICFIVSYLPVTQSWYISLANQSNLSRLIISAIKVKKQILHGASDKEVSRSMRSIFHELKLATGQINLNKIPKKKSINLTEIKADLPVPGLSQYSYCYDDFFSLIVYESIFYQLDQLPPDPPPPEHNFTV